MQKQTNLRMQVRRLRRPATTRLRPACTLGAPWLTRAVRRVRCSACCTRKGRAARPCRCATVPCRSREPGKRQIWGGGAQPLAAC
jgi:hypothetical protein